MKKILIITYYWPPFGGSGVQRWLKFVKYLPSFGYQPFVFTPENPFV
ncbi:MAG: glycosyl transferase, partial [Cytophagales bacterium]